MPHLAAWILFKTGIPFPATQPTKHCSAPSSFTFYVGDSTEPRLSTLSIWRPIVRGISRNLFRAFVHSFEFRLSLVRSSSLWSVASRSFRRASLRRPPFVALRCPVPVPRPTSYTQSIPHVLHTYNGTTFKTSIFEAYSGLFSGFSLFFYAARKYHRWGITFRSIPQIVEND